MRLELMPMLGMALLLVACGAPLDNDAGAPNDVSAPVDAGDETMEGVRDTDEARERDPNPVSDLPGSTSYPYRESVEDIVEMASIVVLGGPTGFERGMRTFPVPGNLPPASVGFTRIRFEVESYLLGDGPKEIDLVITDMSPSARFSLGEEYVVFIGQIESELETWGGWPVNDSQRIWLVENGLVAPPGARHLGSLSLDELRERLADVEP